MSLISSYAQCTLSLWPFIKGLILLQCALNIHKVQLAVLQLTVIPNFALDGSMQFIALCKVYVMVNMSILTFRSWDSSVSITCWMAVEWLPGGQEIFSLFHSIYTSSGAHPALCTMGTSGSFPGVNWQGYEDDHSLLSTVERDNFTFTFIFTEHLQSKLIWSILVCLVSLYIEKNTSFLKQKLTSKNKKIYLKDY
jgi:hypothetical protein